MLFNTVKPSGLKQHWQIISRGSVGGLRHSSAGLTGACSCGCPGLEVSHHSHGWHLVLTVGWVPQSLFSWLLLVWKAKPASFYGDLGNISRDRSRSYKASWALALEITQNHCPTFCWPEQNHKTSRDWTGGGERDSAIKQLHLWFSPVHYRDFCLC